MELPLWLSISAGIACGLMSAYMFWDAQELRREMKRLTGDTRQETLNRLRAHVVVMRREYRLKPGDRFAIEMAEACDKLEETMRRLEENEWQAVR